MSSPLSSPPLGFPIIDTSSGLTVRVGRQRSSSLLKVEKLGENSQEEDLDENVYDNVNAEWVNRKGEARRHSLELIHESLGVAAQMLYFLLITLTPLYLHQAHGSCTPSSYLWERSS